jgi:hypothetical protein
MSSILQSASPTMMRYVASFYRTGESFSDETMRDTLVALDALGAGFFPASIWLSSHDKATLLTPADYRRSLVPEGYYIGPGFARVPFECSNGVAMAFTESNNPRSMPANLVMEFSDATVRNSGWSLHNLVRIFKATISTFAPTYASLYDEAHRARPAYEKRVFEYDSRCVPSGLYWVNYFSREWVANLGEVRLRQLAKAVALAEWLPDGGVLIALQEEPYDEGNLLHRDRQVLLEEKVLDLPAIQARFPNLGL